MILHLRAAVEQLYAVPPARFTPLRSELVAQAKSAGDKALAASVGALRKPTVAAWAVNHFVREHRDEVDELRSFAELLREAQRTLDADQLRVLGRERAKRVDVVADRIAEVAAEEGQRLGAGVAQEVRDTLTALIADEDAEASVLTGSLVKALSYSGFGSVDLADAVALGDEATPNRGAAERPSLSVLPGGGGGDAGGDGAGGDGEAVDLEERRRARRAAERARLQAALETARSGLRSADRQVAVLTARQEEVVEGVADLERRLAAARARLEKVTGELEEAGRIRDRREQQEAAAQSALDAHDGDERGAARDD
ncbi:hypothetical protein [Terrabacter sp. NPDC080008]|uniref:hypothetical protein n=1 Tax=Terrabacter sp. NPDC080008 TaxID=3155176 RepID=UPI00344FEAF3